MCFVYFAVFQANFCVFVFAFVIWSWCSTDCWWFRFFVFCVLLCFLGVSTKFEFLSFWFLVILMVFVRFFGIFAWFGVGIIYFCAVSWCF